ARLAQQAGDELAARAETFGATRAVVGWLPQFDVDGLRLVGDRVREELGGHSAGLLAGGVKDDRLSYIIFVGDDLKGTLPAGRLARTVGAAFGGGGGGRPELASGGGRVDRLEAGQEAFRAELRNLAADAPEPGNPVG
ncbi:MAG TPA: hypothetical protein ENN51_05625, partial [candidate division WOR-3 bacterium]|nr:hypothetical protein [candidate division WOR-3 bacterium]